MAAVGIKYLIAVPRREGGSGASPCWEFSHSCWVQCVFEQGLQLNHLRFVFFAERAPVLPRGGGLAVCAMDAGGQTPGPSPAVSKEKTLGGWLPFIFYLKTVFDWKAVFSILSLDSWVHTALKPVKCFCIFLGIPAGGCYRDRVLPACFPDLDPASNLLLRTPYVGNDQNSVSGLGFGCWFRNSLTGCWMHFCGWQWETEMELAGRFLSYLC